jgi:hypothetical protein
MVKAERWTLPGNYYFAMLDSIKIVMGRKKKELIERAYDKNYRGAKTAAEFYGVWGISGSQGPYKF